MWLCIKVKLYVLLFAHTCFFSSSISLNVNYHFIQISKFCFSTVANHMFISFFLKVKEKKPENATETVTEKNIETKGTFI